MAFVFEDSRQILKMTSQLTQDWAAREEEGDISER